MNSVISSFPAKIEVRNQSFPVRLICERLIEGKAYRFDQIAAIAENTKTANFNGCEILTQSLKRLGVSDNIDAKDLSEFFYSVFTKYRYLTFEDWVNYNIALVEAHFGELFNLITITKLYHFFDQFIEARNVEFKREAERIFDKLDGEAYYAAVERLYGRNLRGK